VGGELINGGEEMERIPINKLEQVAKNRYAAVLIAAKHARKLNKKRVAEKEQMESSEEGEDAQTKIESSTKVVGEALRDLLEGKIKYEFPRR